MVIDPIRATLESLRSADNRELERSLLELSERLAAMPEADYRGAVEAVCSLFYIDTYDRPDLEPALDLAVQVLARQGVRVAPLLLEFMEGSDIKSHLHLAQAIGAIGPGVVPQLRRFIATADDPYGRAFALFALGKVRDSAVHDALPEVVGALMHPDKEVRDSAARTLGKIAEVTPAEALTERRRTELFEALYRTLSDRLPAVRAKAIRSLGKLAGARYLNAAQVDKLRTTLLRLAGKDEQYDWDQAFIVRREAEEALARLR